MAPSLNEHIYRLTNELWEVHLTLANSGGEEALDPDLLRGLRAAADYIRHSIWVRDEHNRDPIGRTVEEILLTQRLKRACEMLESALSQVQDLHLSAEDASQLEKIRTLSFHIRKPGEKVFVNQDVD
jgi:hypothetical protein